MHHSQSTQRTLACTTHSAHGAHSHASVTVHTAHTCMHQSQCTQRTLACTIYSAHTARLHAPFTVPTQRVCMHRSQHWRRSAKLTLVSWAWALLAHACLGGCHCSGPTQRPPVLKCLGRVLEGCTCAAQHVVLCVAIQHAHGTAGKSESVVLLCWHSARAWHCRQE
eukprot:scaffold29750_cov26-Tisochrysis_lutea.AAC.1